MISIEQITNSSDVADIPLNLTSTTIYSKSFILENYQDFCLAYKASTANPSLTLQVEQGMVLPQTEGNEDANWNIPTNQNDVVTLLNTSAIQFTSFSPAPVPYGRIKITTKIGTPTNTTINMKLCCYEDYA